MRDRMWSVDEVIFVRYECKVGLDRVDGIDQCVVSLL